MILPVLLLTTLVQAPLAPPAGSFVVTHQAVDCVVADKHPRFEAQAPQGVEVAAARVFFQGASQEWYSVAMKAEGPKFVGVLPAPRRSLREFHYYIEATSKNLDISRTADRATRVVASAGDCRGIAAASAVSTASILVQGPAGAAAVPSGFAPTGLVAAGGGISATTVAVVGAGVVGAGALAATQMGGEESRGYAGSMSGELTIVFGPCVRLERYSLVLTIELTGETSGTAGSDPGRYEVVSASNCATGPQTGFSSPFGISQTPVTRAGSAISFAYRESVAGGGETQLDFKGTLSGDTISGTATLVSRVPNLTGISVSTPLVAPVTLTPRK